jgi:4-hydroxy-3-methylbut-2-enyl diphosphate reductase
MQASLLPAAPAGFEVRLALTKGHGDETRQALAKADLLLKRGPMTLLGPLAPDAALCETYRRRGMLEGSPTEYRAPTRIVVVPLTGLPKACIRKWRENGHEVLDLTLPAVRRAQTALGLLTLEHCLPIVIGQHDAPEALAIAGESQGCKVCEDADQAAELPFAPKFGLVCQTTISKRRAHAVAEALRLRHPDSRIVFLDTTTPAMTERERSVDGLSRWADSNIVAGERNDSSVRALIEAARRLGLAAHAVPNAGALDLRDFTGCHRIGITAGEFSPDAVADGIAARLETEAAAEG